jgi:uncharacterized protein involved in propanediol utilization
VTNSAIADLEQNPTQGSIHGYGAVFSGICHGTLGELIQGPFIQDDELHISLISLPIKKYSIAHFIRTEDESFNTELANKEKCRRAIDIYLSLHQRRLPRGKWVYDSELVQGKGMASSTADIVATIRCLDSIFTRQSSVESITCILREIERSDSVFLNEYALYLSGRQQAIHRLNGDPKFHAVYIDEGNTIDTDKAGKPLLAHYERNLPAYLTNLNRAVNAFHIQDWATLAHCATASAILGQGVIPKHNLDILLEKQNRYKADGIVVAHTGSLLGYLYIRPPNSTEMGELSSFFRSLGYPCRFIQTGF